MKIVFNLLVIGLFFATFSCENKSKNTGIETAEVEGERGIKFFKGSFKEAKLKAKTEGKMIFMDAYTSWCGPCKMMQKNTFPDDLVGKVFNEKFVSVAFDMEVGEGLELSSVYPIQGFPTLLFLDAEGKIISAELGYRDPAGLIALGNNFGNKL